MTLKNKYRYSRIVGTLHLTHSQQICMLIAKAAINPFNRLKGEKRTLRAERPEGSSWLKDMPRLAIQLSGKSRCAYCFAKYEGKVECVHGSYETSIDHIVPWSAYQYAIEFIEDIANGLYEGRPIYVQIGDSRRYKEIEPGWFLQHQERLSSRITGRNAKTNLIFACAT